MNRFLNVLLIIMFLTSNNVYSQSYDQMWKQVERAADDDLPRQVISTSEKIMSKARKDNNFGQLMRAWVTIVETKTILDTDSFDVKLFPEVKPRNEAETAIYNAIMAAAFSNASHSYTTIYDEETQTKYDEEQHRHIGSHTSRCIQTACRQWRGQPPLRPRPPLAAHAIRDGAM